MSPLSWLKEILAAYRAWRWRRLVGPTLKKIAEVDADIERAKRQHTTVRPLYAKKKALRNKQLIQELRI